MSEEPVGEEPVGVASLLLSRARDDNPGLIFEGRTWTWASVVAESQARAGALASLRPEGPFHVGVLLENVPEFVFLLGGAALCGATIVGINPTRRGAELERDVRHTDCAVVLTEPSQSAVLDGLEVGPVYDVEASEWRALLARHRDWAAPVALPDPTTTLLLIFTSGSTGAPKAVRMSQGRAARTASKSVFTPDDVLYCAMPLFHGNSLLSNLFPAMATGATVVLRRRFSASAFVPDVRAHGCTFFNGVGRALSYILAVPPSADDKGTTLKWVLGPESSPRDARQFRRRFGVPVIEGYGSSENAVVIQPGPGMPRGALGKPSPGLDVAILDPSTGHECPTVRFDADGLIVNAEEAIGEIVGRNSVGMFEGYYNNPEAEEERTRGGWYWSGDLGYRDEDGWFWFAGRTADWLRVDGENFAAAPIERIIGRLPGVDGVAVYAVPDPATGDQVMAAVQMESSAAFDAVALDAFLAEQRDLGTKWAPKFVRVVETLPVTATNKVDKKPLRADRWEHGNVWWRPARGEGYRLMTPGDVISLNEQFAANGRSGVLGQRAQPG